MNCILYNYYNFVCSINMRIRQEFQRVIRKIDITLQNLKAALVLVIFKTTSLQFHGNTKILNIVLEKLPYGTLASCWLY